MMWIQVVWRKQHKKLQDCVGAIDIHYLCSKEIGVGSINGVMVHCSVTCGRGKQIAERTDGKSTLDSQGMMELTWSVRVVVRTIHTFLLSVCCAPPPSMASLKLLWSCAEQPLFLRSQSCKCPSRAGPREGFISLPPQLMHLCKGVHRVLASVSLLGGVNHPLCISGTLVTAREASAWFHRTKV